MAPVLLPLEIPPPFSDGSKQLFRHYCKRVRQTHFLPLGIEDEHLVIRNLLFKHLHCKIFRVMQAGLPAVAFTTDHPYIKTVPEPRRLQSTVPFWLTGFCIKNKVTAPMKGASVRRGSSITRKVPYNCKYNRSRKTLWRYAQVQFQNSVFQWSKCILKSHLK